MVHVTRQSFLFLKLCSYTCPLPYLYIPGQSFPALRKVWRAEGLEPARGHRACEPWGLDSHSARPEELCVTPVTKWVRCIHFLQSNKWRGRVALLNKVRVRTLDRLVQPFWKVTLEVLEKLSCVCCVTYRLLSWVCTWLGENVVTGAPLKFLPQSFG